MEYALCFELSWMTLLSIFKENCLKARSMRRQFTFYHSVPRNSWYSFYQPQKDERQSRLCSHAMVLNRGPLDWESNTLTTRPFFHVLVITWNRKNWRPHHSSFLNIIICSKCTIIQKGIYTRQPCSRREIYFKKSQKQGVFFNMSLKAHSKVWDNFWQLKTH